MIKYLVLWTVLQMVQVPCPQVQPYTDEYGVYHQIQSVNAVACNESKQTAMSKLFDSKEAAEQFIQDAKKQNNWSTILSNFVIRETYSGELEGP